jgi:hypothetical protein
MFLLAHQWAEEEGEPHSNGIPFHEIIAMPASNDPELDEFIHCELVTI